MEIDNTQAHSPQALSALCPHCGHNGTFEAVGIQDVLSRANSTVFGVRRCPRGECHGYLFVVKQLDGTILRTSPNLTLDFDSSSIPEEVAACLKEAIECHANGNQIASAIMVRKTLEELCHEKGAKGKDLKEKIKDLGTKIVIPQSLINGMDKLRLLGNDAAHVEARIFTDIGTQELEVAIRFTKEVLKAVYQYDSLLNELEGLQNKGDEAS